MARAGTLDHLVKFSPDHHTNLLVSEWKTANYVSKKEIDSCADYKKNFRETF